jgi:hypothetical protein
MTRRLIAAIWLIAIAACNVATGAAAPTTAPAPTAAAGAITVTRAPARVILRPFDPAHPPPEMPPLSQDEAAVTQSKFACGVKLDVEITQASGEKPSARIAGVDATLRLDVILWLPRDASNKIRAHEEGHRKLSELYYASAEPVARALAQKYVGRTLDIPGIEPSQTRAIIERAANEFCQEYLGQIEVPSQAAQEKYDKLTNHGRNRLDEGEAIRRAVASTRLPSTQPG